MSTWGESSNSPVTGLHAMYGLGLTLGPLVVRPFLSSTSKKPGLNSTRESSLWDGLSQYNESRGIQLQSAWASQQNATEQNKTLQNLATRNYTNNPSDSSYFNYSFNSPTHAATAINGSRIEIAFWIVALLSFVASVLVFTSYCVGPPTGFKFSVSTKENARTTFQRECCGNQMLSTISMMLFFWLFYVWSAGRENMLHVWLFDYAVDSNLKFSQQDAALLDFAAKFAFFLGRLVATAIAVKVSVQVMLICEVRFISVMISAQFKVTSNLFNKQCMFYY